MAGNVLEMFKDVLMQCQLEYAKHEKEKGDSWNEVPMITLYGKLNEELEEYCGTDLHSEEEFEELIDMILVAMMLAQRLIEFNRRLEVDSGG